MLDHPAENERAFERLLRDNGFSRTRAKVITSKGFKGGDLETGESAEIAEMVVELNAKREALLVTKTRSVLDNIDKFFGYATSINSVSLFPGESNDDIAILPVALGKVRFTVKAPQGVNFECKIRYYKFTNRGRAIRDEITLNHNKPSRSVDRGIQRSPLPPTELHEIYAYLRKLPRNLILGSTRAMLKHLPYDEGDPRRGERSRVKFILSATSEE